MRSMFLVFGAMTLLSSIGCSGNTTTAMAPAGELLVLEVTEIDLLPDTTKDVKVKTGKADKAEGPAADTGVTAKLVGDKITVSAGKDAKEATHTVKVSGGKKDAEIKVKVGKKDKEVVKDHEVKDKDTKEK